jgi:hypothetical protein
MSTDFNIKPVGAPVAAPIAQPLSDAAQNAVATVLAASQSVAAVDAGSRAGSSFAPPPTPLSHQVFLDQEAAAIVFQVVDERTNAVVRQFPDEAVLRRRAYFHTLDLTKDQPTRLGATDRRA